MATLPAPHVEQSAPAGHTPRAVRLDVQALRAVAVLGVLVYHLFPSLLPGGFVGVDVFFVISGYLITTHLLSRPPSRPSDFARFWGRRILRLLPPVLLVVLATLGGVLAFVSSGQWAQLAREAATSMLYVQNWQLISDATDYLDANRAVSPFQHFWSLSVEEQYYIAWPFVVAGLVWLGTRGRRGRRAVQGSRPAARPGVVIGGFAALVLASLAYGIHQTTAAPDVAYFSTLTRMWELGLGSLLAAAYPLLRPRLGARARVGIFWLGAALIALAFALITGATPFPGVAALLPTVGAAAVLLASDPDHRLNPRFLTHARPVQLVGDVSYALYLWHWPLIVIAPYALGREARVAEKLVILVAALVLAWLSTTLVENPVRSSRWLTARLRRTYGLGVVLTATVLLASLAVTVHVERQVAESNARVEVALRSAKSCLGAAAMEPGRDCAERDTLVTSPAFAKADVTSGIRECLNWPPFKSSPISCARGDTTDPTKRIALFGNSHAGHWVEAMASLGRENGWEVDTYIMGACFSVIEPQGDDCNAIVGPAGEEIVDGDYDAVVMSTFDRDEASTPARYASTISAFAASGAHVLVIRDTPAPLDQGNEPPDCIAANSDDWAACSGPRKEWIGRDDLTKAAKRLRSRDVSTVNLNRYLCGPRTCPAVIGGVIVYSDFNHMSKTFSKTLAPYLEPALRRAVS